MTDIEKKAREIVTTFGNGEYPRDCELFAAIKEGLLKMREETIEQCAKVAEDDAEYCRGEWSKYQRGSVEWQIWALTSATAVNIRNLIKAMKGTV